MSGASVLDLDPVEVASTWAAIQGRIEKSPTFQVVSEEALATIENVILANHDEAFDRWPKFTDEHKKYRVQFWKAALIDAVPAEKAGIFAVYYHEYIASIERSERGSAEDEAAMPLPSYGGHARAARDAWMACTASLA